MGSVGSERVSRTKIIKDLAKHQTTPMESMWHPGNCNCIHTLTEDVHIVD